MCLTVIATVTSARMLVAVCTSPSDVSLAAMPADDFPPEQICNVWNVLARGCKRQPFLRLLKYLLRESREKTDLFG